MEQDKRRPVDGVERGRRSGHAPRPLIGAHISSAGGFVAVPDRAVAIGAEVVQMFSSNSRTWRTRQPDAEEIAAFVAGLRRRRLPLFFHAIYLINLSSPDEEIWRRSNEALAHALGLGAICGAKGVVTHIGSHKGEGVEKATRQVAAAVQTACRLARRSLSAWHSEAGLPALLLENGTGSGNTMGGTFQELADLLAAADEVNSGEAGFPVLGLCLDTAHLFAAGYAVHTSEGLEDVVTDLRRLRLLGRLRLLHLNDSAAPFACKRDRHQNPGDGEIGYEGLAGVVRHPALNRVPFVLEVPGPEGHGPDATNLALVRTMREEAASPPRGPAHGA